MKKLFLLIAFASPLMLVMQSCEKINDKKDRDDKVVYQTVDAAINANETYTFTLPSANADNPFKITSQASHYQLSRIENNAALFKYIPAADYTGADQVIISNAGNGNGGCQKNNGKDETQKVITINLTIKEINIHK